MSTTQSLSIGNPVDTWWNETRREIDPCIELLAQFPPAANSSAAIEALPSIRDAYDYVENAYFPHQAHKVREFLLESLHYLILSLKEQAAHGLMAPDASHNIAYHKFLMVSYFLLQRGIYEPEPTKYSKRKAS